MTKKKLTITLFSALVALLLFLSFRSSPVLIDVATATSGDFSITIEEEGITRARDVYTVSAPVRGYARRITQDVGDKVSKDMLLIRIEPSRSEALDARSHAQARARVDAARATLKSAVEQARAAAADADFARKELTRTRELFKRKMISLEKLDQAQAQAQHKTAMQRSAASAVKVAEYNLKTAQTTLAWYSANGTAQKGETIDITSPIDGSILKIHRRSEGVVQPGQLLVDIGNTRELEVVVEVLSADAVRLKPGTRVYLERWGGKRLNGLVRVIEPVGYTKPSALGVEEQRVRVIVDITSPTSDWQKLGHGYRVEAKFVLWESRNVLQVPASALFRVGEQWAVFVVERRKAVRRIIRPGRNNGLQAQVLEGLREGERIISHPDESIEDGTRIKER